ncbi:MAG: hypothetical protein SPG61_01595 [Arcanobacterium sp.]|nr:hypothetical protein [Arcanobacterium sp.]
MKLCFLFALPAPYVQKYLQEQEQQGVQVADLTSFFPSSDYDLPEDEFWLKRDETLTKSLEVLRELIFDVQQRYADAQQSSEILISEDAAVTESISEKGPRFLIHVPNFLLRHRSEELKRIIETAIPIVPTEVAYLKQEIARLILENELFGAKNSLVLPRKIVREQIFELEKFLANFNYVILPSIS